MEGRLIIVPRNGTHTAPIFLSGTARRCILVIGSQSEGLFDTPYAAELADALKGKWAVAQVMLGSSLAGRRVSSHEADADDVDAALAVLVKDYEMSEVVLYASGTGVQIALEVMASAPRAEVVTRLVLQGGIVPPQSSKLFSAEESKHRVEVARVLIAEQRGDNAAAMAHVYDMTVTPARLSRNATLTVQEALWQPVLGDSESTCKQTLHGVTVPTLFLLSTESSYTASAQSALPAVQRVATETTGLTSEDVQIALIPSTIDEHRRVLKGNASLAVKMVDDFLRKADARREQREASAAAVAAKEERKKRLGQVKALCT
ncbi:hypothetical protein LSCM1_00510 [Leishmania martiniquensis]|uniref:Paraflagellar rod component n=1 Tax=Leishmania martiniquensis TaxID=1580590 RepID=A0A836GI65_9TRYP|nr:hypothetical protein LSCM1_00510 [Leishmania martiniquensis]